MREQISRRWLLKTGAGLGATVSFFGLTGFRGFSSLFAPDADLWPRWEAHDNSNQAIIDYQDWAVLLRNYVTATPQGLNLFAYADVTDADKAQLSQVISRLEAVPISGYSRPEQMAFWINLYNAVTVRVVLDHYPVKSIQDIDLGGGLFSKGPWGAKLTSVEGEALSLNDIEHRILRPIWADPRIHYAVNCASIGCPNLRLEPWHAADMDEALDDAARAYLAHPRGISVDGDVITVSSIYDWFYEDFNQQGSDLMGHLRTYSPPQIKAELERLGEIHRAQYDWRLNTPENAS